MQKIGSKQKCGGEEMNVNRAQNLQVVLLEVDIVTGVIKVKSPSKTVMISCVLDGRIKLTCPPAKEDLAKMLDGLTVGNVVCYHSKHLKILSIKNLRNEAATAIISRLKAGISPCSPESISGYAS
jgi:hypothetical protein